MSAALLARVKTCHVANTGRQSAREGDHPICTNEVRKIGETLALRQGQRPLVKSAIG